ncbi:MAG: DUF3048 domain-containing protein [Actinobacteria bacterium]|nr:DUF3048 domain-containing protein [Actinomycetota bacterium]
MRSPLLPAGVLVLVLAAAACSDGSAATPLPPGDGAAPSASSDEGVATTAPAPVPGPVAPLTGEAVDDPAVADRPVLAVKIENTAAARPQAGLDLADIVYEEIVEGGVTRFIALFQSEVPDVVGPVRSARPEDVAILPAYTPILAYSGARDEVTQMLRASGIVLLTDDGGDAFSRDPGRSRSHDLMGDGPRLYEKGDATAVGAATPVFARDATPPAGAVACDAATPDCGTAATIRFSGAAVTGWTWDADAGVYRRDQDGEPSRVTGPGRIGAANVVVLGMHVGQGGCCDAAGTPFTETTILGDGAAVVLRDGRRYDVRWRKTAAGSHLELLAADGAPFPLAPGPTWIHLAPADRLPS